MARNLLKEIIHTLTEPRVYTLDLNDEAVKEEAIAEMFRDAMDGKLKLAGRPKTLMQRFIDFFKSIFNAHEENGFQNVDDIFENIGQEI